MSDKPTIPLKDDGSPDWKRINNPCGYSECDLRTFYIAGLERCAEWHERQAKYVATRVDAANRDAMKDAARSFAAMCDAHLQSAATICKWIEKEKANG